MNFILGGGLSGFVVALYFKTYTILAKGKGQDANYLGPRILRRCAEVDEFMKKFVNQGRREKPIELNTYKAGYSLNGKITTEISRSDVDTYLQKTRGPNWKEFQDGGMNGGETEIEGYDMVQVYQELSSRFDLKTRRIFVNIKKINREKNVISGVNPAHKEIRLAFLYNKIINTLPAMLFNSLVEGEFIRLSDSQIYVCMLDSREMYDKMEDKDFVYFPDPDVAYYRATKIGKNKIALESRRVFLPKKDLPFSCKVIKVIQIPFGKLTEKEEPLKGENIAHVGRYATSDQKMRIHSLIKLLENKEVRI